MLQITNKLKQSGLNPFSAYQDEENYLMQSFMANL